MYACARRSEVDDLALFESWCAGDRSAGDALLARHVASLCAFFVRRCAEPDDLVQRTLLACIRSKHQFRAQASFRTYLFVIARNELYGYRQRARKDDARDDECDVNGVPDAMPNPATQLARWAEKQRVVEALGQLHLEQQRLLALYYWSNLAVAQLAEVFDLTPNAVRVRLHRARLALRELLG